jgi:ketosteroid isomerase-like protein
VSLRVCRPIGTAGLFSDQIPSDHKEKAMTHPNEELARTGYYEFTKGGIGTVIHLFADDFVWHIGGRNRFSRDWRGKYGVSDFFRQLMDFTLGTFDVEVRDVLVSDDHAAVLVRERARRDGTVHDMNTVHLWRVRDRWWERGEREGTFVEFWRYPSDTYADDQFFA